MKFSGMLFCDIILPTIPNIILCNSSIIPTKCIKDEQNVALKFT